MQRNDLPLLTRRVRLPTGNRRTDRLTTTRNSVLWKEPRI